MCLACLLYDLGLLAVVLCAVIAQANAPCHNRFAILSFCLSSALCSRLCTARAPSNPTTQCLKHTTLPQPLSAVASIIHELIKHPQISGAFPASPACAIWLSVARVVSSLELGGSCNPSDLHQLVERWMCSQGVILVSSRPCHGNGTDDFYWMSRRDSFFTRWMEIPAPDCLACAYLSL